MVMGLVRRYGAAAILVGSAVLLAGCNGTTYGTGRSPGMQTLQDFAGVAALSEKKEPIDYKSRPPVVAPPQAGALPPPQAGSQAYASADWPDDPDQRARLIREQQLARQQANQSDPEYKPLNQYDPKFRLPEGSQARLLRDDVSPSEAARGSREEDARARKAFAQARGDVTFDANGNPVRRYLTEPPSAYRLPDPDAPPPELIAECKPKFRWPWQKADPNDPCSK